MTNPKKEVIESELHKIRAIFNNDNFGWKILIERAKIMYDRHLAVPYPSLLIHLGQLKQVCFSEEHNTLALLGIKPSTTR